jgi:hypothetical protein
MRAELINTITDGNSILAHEGELVEVLDVLTDGLFLARQNGPDHTWFALSQSDCHIVCND